MNPEKVVLDIRKLHQALTNKTDQDVQITHRGTSHGIKFPWHVRIDSHETSALTCEAAMETLRDALKVALEKKADEMQRDAEQLHRIVDGMRN